MNKNKIKPLNVRRIRALLKANGLEAVNLIGDWTNRIDVKPFSEPVVAYMERCLVWDGTKKQGILLCGNSDLGSYNYMSFPAAFLRPLGFLAIASTGRGSSRIVEFDNVVVVDSKSGHVYWANYLNYPHEPAIAKRPIYDLKVKLNRAEAVAGLTKLADSIEDFLEGYFSGSLIPRLKELEASSGTRAPANTVADQLMADHTDNRLLRVMKKRIAPLSPSAQVRAVKAELKKQAKSPFHMVVPCTLLGQVDEFTDRIKTEYRAANRKAIPARLHCEMENFRLNPQTWQASITMFTSKKRGTIPSYVAKRDFVIRGLDRLGDAFVKSYTMTDARKHKATATLAVLCVACMFRELVQAAYNRLLKENHPVASVLISTDVHDEDLFFELQNERPSASRTKRR